MKTINEYEQGYEKMQGFYDWALSQINIGKAHKITRGVQDVAVSVIDLGYRHHPFMDGHLWVNPKGAEYGLHGWDCEDDDASIEYSGIYGADTDYYRGHHVFVCGEVAACAPLCPIMPVRVGYFNTASWGKGIRYAVDNGAKILVIPHGYLQGQNRFGVGLFYKGTDFGYPDDNPSVIEALEYAYDNGCLIMQGTADNRGRRAASYSAIDAVCAVGSSNRDFGPADICCSADYVEFGAPGGQRDGTCRGKIIGCGGDNNTIEFTGGCMASGFAGGVAALAMSRYPGLDNNRLRQILRNTAAQPADVERDENGWESKLGYGILDAYKAVSLDDSQLCISLSADLYGCTICSKKKIMEIMVKNTGAFDALRAIAVLYNGDPASPADDSGTLLKPAPELQTKQIGHSVFSVRGLATKKISIKLYQEIPENIWIEIYSLEKHSGYRVFRGRFNVITAS